MSEKLTDLKKLTKELKELPQSVKLFLENIASKSFNIEFNTQPENQQVLESSVQAKINDELLKAGVNISNLDFEFKLNPGTFPFVESKLLIRLKAQENIVSSISNIESYTLELNFKRYNKKKQIIELDQLRADIRKKKETNIVENLEEKLINEKYDLQKNLVPNLIEALEVHSNEIIEMFRQQWPIFLQLLKDYPDVLNLRVGNKNYNYLYPFYGASIDLMLQDPDLVEDSPISLAYLIIWYLNDVYSIATNPKYLDDNRKYKFVCEIFDISEFVNINLSQPQTLSNIFIQSGLTVLACEAAIYLITAKRDIFKEDLSEPEQKLVEFTEFMHTSTGKKIREGGISFVDCSNMFLQSCNTMLKKPESQMGYYDQIKYRTQIIEAELVGNAVNFVEQFVILDRFLNKSRISKHDYATRTDETLEAAEDKNTEILVPIEEVIPSHTDQESLLDFIRSEDQGDDVDINVDQEIVKEKIKFTIEIEGDWQNVTSAFCENFGFSKHVLIKTLITDIESTVKGIKNRNKTPISALSSQFLSWVQANTNNKDLLSPDGGFTPYFYFRSNIYFSYLLSQINEYRLVSQTEEHLESLLNLEIGSSTMVKLPRSGKINKNDIIDKYNNLVLFKRLIIRYGSNIEAMFKDDLNTPSFDLKKRKYDNSRDVDVFSFRLSRSRRCYFVLNEGVIEILSIGEHL